MLACLGSASAAALPPSSTTSLVQIIAAGARHPWSHSRAQGRAEYTEGTVGDAFCLQYPIKIVHLLR